MRTEEHLEKKELLQTLFITVVLHLYAVTGAVPVSEPTVLQLMDKYPKGYCPGCFLLLRPALALRPVTSDLHRRYFPPN
jgi:hypothetical protein